MDFNLNKKGENDLIVVVVSLFTIAILGLIVLLVNSNTVPVMQSLTSGNESLAYEAIGKAGTTFQDGLDNLFVGIFVILIIGMIILSLYISASPIFLFIFILIASIATWIAAIIANAYMMVEATGVFNTVLDYLPKQNFIMENLPFFTAGLAFLLLIVTYSKDLFGGQVNYQ